MNVSAAMRRMLGSANENGELTDGAQDGNFDEACPTNQMTCIGGGADDENEQNYVDQTNGQELQSCGGTESCTAELQQQPSDSSSVKYCTRKVTPPHKRQCLCKKLGKLESGTLRENCQKNFFLMVPRLQSSDQLPAVDEAPTHATKTRTSVLVG